EPFALFELERREPEVHQHAVHGRELKLPADRPHVAEVALHESHPVEAGEPLLPARDRRRVGIDADESAAGLRSLEDRFGMAGAAERAVDITPTGLHVERGEDFVQHHRDVPWRRHNHQPRGPIDSSAAGSSSATRTASSAYASGSHTSSQSYMPSTSTFVDSPA